MSRAERRSRWASLAVVVTVHAVVIVWMGQQRSSREPSAVMPLQVELLSPPPLAPPIVPPARRAPPTATQAAPMREAAASAPPPPDPVAAAVVAAKEPRRTAEPMPAPVAAGPVNLGSDPELACPHRPAPTYPLAARRMGEVGMVRVAFEIDESGRVDVASIVTGSGSARLDEAALAAVRGWRCTPQQLGGRAVRASARQTIKFVLQGN